MAQTDGCLIIKEYDPDSWEVLYYGNSREVDINDDGLYDFKYWVTWGPEYITQERLEAREGACYYCISTNYICGVNTFSDLDIPFNDTSLVWFSSSSGTHAAIHPEKMECEYHRLDTIPFTSGIRNEVDGDYYYGWIEIYAVNTFDNVHFHVARTCFCTIPNYPLHWGQTTFNWTDADENESVFATVHPSPTNGQVVITGNDLRSAEVYNASGQRIMATHGSGNQLQLDLSGQPAGIYFLNITDKDGRRCVRKVVKQ